MTMYRKLRPATQQKTLMHLLRRLIGGAVLVAVFVAPHAVMSAQQDEIQVYADDISKRGEFGLEWHLNTTPEGRTKPDYPGEITNNHGFRFTPEFSYGLTSDVELGLYLPMLVDGSGDYHFVGVKYRLKWLPIRPKDDAEGWFLGTNTELSRVGYKFSESPWTTELRPIIGYKGKDWLFAFNPILDWDLSNGLASWDPTFVPSVKLNREVVRASHWAPSTTRTWASSSRSSPGTSRTTASTAPSTST